MNLYFIRCESAILGVFCAKWSFKVLYI